MTIPKHLGEACRLTPILAEMRKALAVGIIALGMLAGCAIEESNHSLVSIEDKYDFADIRLFDGTIKTVRVVSWSDCVYNDHVTIHDADGVTWHLHYSNVIMRKAAKDATR